MTIKTLISSVVLALSTLAANAASTAPVQVYGPSFSDVLLTSFTLDEASVVSGALGYAPYVLVAPNFQIALPPVTFTSLLAFNTDQSPTTWATLAGDNFTFSNLAAGTYQLRTSGTVDGFNLIGAQYTISQFTVTLVPEPETFAMLLAGLGLVGGLARRQKMIARNEAQAVLLLQ